LLTNVKVIRAVIHEISGYQNRICTKGFDLWENRIDSV
jgi:hypothetical protein